MYQKLQREEIYVALVKDDYHWHWRDSKRLADIDDNWMVSQQPLDLQLLPQLPQIRINHGGHITHMIERWWNANFTLAPRVAMQVDKLEVCLAMVERGFVYAIVSSPRSALVRWLVRHLKAEPGCSFVMPAAMRQ